MAPRPAVVSKRKPVRRKPAGGRLVGRKAAASASDSGDQPLIEQVVPAEAAAVAAKPRRRRKVTKAALIDRLWQAADRQVADIEQTLANAHVEPTDRERVTRTLAAVVKTIHDLTRIDDTKTPGTGAGSHPVADQDAEHSAVEEDDLRRRLAEHIDRIRREGSAEPVSGQP